MLHSLEIRNYRNLRHLTIERLGRVNLLLGKNNTGKTSVLEAVSIFIHKANPQWLYRVLETRGEIGYGSYADSSDYLATNLDAISNIFADRKSTFNNQDAIGVNAEIVTSSVTENSVLMRLVNYIEEVDEEIGRISRIVVNDDDSNSKIGLFITIDQISRVVSLDRRLGRPALYSGLKDNFQFVRTNEIIRDTNGSLWDKVTLTPKQESIINALKIIEPQIESLNFVAGTKRDERRAIVKIKGEDRPIPLGSMGDGINRILTIILAMVNCENGYLLIDEFENGLHYTVQEQLWKVVFTVAERLNIQAFATTHSYDCVKAFSHVLNSGKYSKDSGCMIRLDNFDGDIEATLYDADEIETTIDVDVDPR